MAFGKKIAALSAAGALALAGMVAGAAPASADDCLGVGQLSWCGTVINQTDYKVHVCTRFSKGKRSDPDFRYYPNNCEEGYEGAVMPHTTWGGSKGVDIDAIRIETGIRYKASRSCHVHAGNSDFPLDHNDDREWWKFPTDCTVTIKSITRA
jgi:hypothetical protein